MRMWFLRLSLRRYLKLRAELSRSLCPEDQKRLLRLVDGLNLLTEEAAFSNYREGLRNGMRLACCGFRLTAGNSGGGRGLRNPDITGTDKGAVNGIGGKTPSRRSIPPPGRISPAGTGKLSPR